jgi:hypothetical protein
LLSSSLSWLEFLLHLAFLCRFYLRSLSLRSHELDLIGVLLLRNVLRRAVLWLLLRWHVLKCQLTDWQASGALVGCVVRVNHLKLESRRV